MKTQPSPYPLTVIDRIRRAVNQHDLEALAGCFHPEYQSEQPIHLDRAFRGRAQMSRNWAQIFAGVPDITADILRSAVDGDTVWTEWHLHGTRIDRSPHHTAMVTIAGVQDDQVVWMRLYMEQVQEGDGIDASVRATFDGQGAAREQLPGAEGAR